MLGAGSFRASVGDEHAAPVSEPFVIAGFSFCGFHVDGGVPLRLALVTSGDFAGLMVLGPTGMPYDRGVVERIIDVWRDCVVPVAVVCLLRMLVGCSWAPTAV